MRSTTSRHRSSAPAARRSAASLPSRQGPGGRSPWRAAASALVLGTATSVAAVLLGLGARAAIGPEPADTSVDLLVAAAVLAAGSLALAVQAFGCLLLTLSHLARAAGRGALALESLAERCTPSLLRRMVAVGVGAGLGLLGPATLAGAAEPDLGWTVTTAASASQASSEAQPVPTPSPSAAPAPTPAALHAATPVASPPAAVVVVDAAEPTGAPAVPVPQAVPSSAAVPSAAPPSTSPGPGDGAVTVQPGDSLWSIASAHLGRPTDARVSAEWPRWYEANRAVIGEDPDLLHPGQVLLAPATTADAS